jgi:catechol 2,3-dioxygenase-like lactoylglutathione lyase family enzyme
MRALPTGSGQALGHPGFDVGSLEKVLVDMKFLLAAVAVLAGIPVSAQNVLVRPPIPGIAQVSVYASSMTRSRNFYGKLLGFPEIGAHGHRYRVNAQQAIQLDLLPKGMADDLESVAFATADVDGLRRYLLGKGIQVPEKIERRTDGTRLFWMKDPEGHRIGFMQLPAVPPGSSHAADDAVSSHILHAGFIVHDRAAEDHFFRDVLGFREGWQGGMKDGVIDWVDMQVPDGTDWIEYMIHGSRSATAAESGVLNHFALGVPNMHEAMEFLDRQGWHATPGQDAQIGRDGKWQLNLYDPDGTRVELMEFRPVETPCCSPYTLVEPK